MSKEEQLQKQIEKLQAQLATAKAEQEFFNDNPTAKLAEDLHSMLCHHNHTDYCDWLYHKWTDSNIGFNRLRYLGAASKIRKADLELEARKIIQMLKDERIV